MRMALGVLLTGALILYAAPPSYASGHEVFREFFSPQGVVQTITERIAGDPRVTSWLQRIGILLSALFFLYNLYMALITQQSGWVSEALMRAAVVGTLLSNLPFLAQVIVDFHRTLSAIGNVVFDALAGPLAFDATLRKLYEAHAAISAAVSGLPWWDIGSRLSSWLMLAIPVLAFFLFLGFAIAVYNFLLLGSYLMLGLAVLMAPLSLACLVTRSMQRFTYEWFQVIVHSALIAMLTKAAVGLVANAAILGAIDRYSDRILAAAAGGGDVLQAATIRVDDLVPVLLGSLVGAFTLLNIQGIASAFVGRVESVAGAIAGMYFAMRAAPAAAGVVATAAVRGVPAAYSAAGAAIDWMSHSRAGSWMHEQYLRARLAGQEILSAAGYAVAHMRARLGFDSTLPYGYDPDMVQYMGSCGRGTTRKPATCWIAAQRPANSSHPANLPNLPQVG